MRAPSNTQRSLWKDRAEIYGHSYGEVLAFLKHEDDKIARVLTALAFLTAGGVSLFVFSGRTQKYPFSLDNATDAADVFFVAFVVFMVVGLLAILAALDPTSQAPRFLQQGAREDSILFYGSIYHSIGSKEPWGVPNEDVEKLQEKFARSLHHDAEELSRRAQHKVHRFADGRAFIHVAVVTLALLGIARADQIMPETRWSLILVLLTLIGFLPGWDIYWQRHFGFAALREALTKSQVFACLLFFVPAIIADVFLFLAPALSGLRPQLLSVSYALVSLVFSQLALRYLRKPTSMGIGASVMALLGLALVFLAWRV